MCEDDLTKLIAAFLAGDSEAGNQIYRIIEPTIRNRVCQFLSSNDPEVDDVVQETIDGTLGYIKDKGEFSGCLESFAVKTARNKCTNIHLWRQRWHFVPIDETDYDPRRYSDEFSPSRLLEKKETAEIVQAGLNKLGSVCRKILRGFYIEGKSIKEIRKKTKLKTEQGVYSRRRVCLKELSRHILKRMGDWNG